MVLLINNQIIIARLVPDIRRNNTAGRREQAENLEQAVHIFSEVYDEPVEYMCTRATALSQISEVFVHSDDNSRALPTSLFCSDVVFFSKFLVHQFALEYYPAICTRWGELSDVHLLPFRVSLWSSRVVECCALLRYNLSLRRISRGRKLLMFALRRRLRQPRSIQAGVPLSKLPWRNYEDRAVLSRWHARRISYAWRSVRSRYSRWPTADSSALFVPPWFRHRTGIASSFCATWRGQVLVSQQVQGLTNVLMGVHRPQMVRNEHSPVPNFIRATGGRATFNRRGVRKVRRCRQRRHHSRQYKDVYWVRCTSFGKTTTPSSPAFRRCGELHAMADYHPPLPLWGSARRRSRTNCLLWILFPRFEYITNLRRYTTGFCCHRERLAINKNTGSGCFNDRSFWEIDVFRDFAVESLSSYNRFFKTKFYVKSLMQNRA